MPLDGWVIPYELSNQTKGAARRIDASKKRLAREELGLNDPVDSKGKFEVYFDDLKLLRPIKFRDLPTTGAQRQCDGQACAAPTRSTNTLLVVKTHWRHIRHHYSEE